MEKMIKELHKYLLEHKLTIKGMAGEIHSGGSRISVLGSRTKGASNERRIYGIIDFNYA